MKQKNSEAERRDHKDVNRGWQETVAPRLVAREHHLYIHIVEKDENAYVTVGIMIKIEGVRITLPEQT